MHKALLLALALVACSTNDAPKTDSAAGAAAGDAAAPATLTADDVAGSWLGVTMAEGTDSIVSRWTSIRESGTTAKLITDNSTDTVSFTIVYAADSMIATSRPYASRTDPKVQVVFHSVGRLKDGKLVGTSMTTLAAKPDSVISRGHWEAMRKP